MSRTHRENFERSPTALSMNTAAATLPGPLQALAAAQRLETTSVRLDHQTLASVDRIADSLNANRGAALRALVLTGLAQVERSAPPAI